MTLPLGSSPFSRVTIYRDSHERPRVINLLFQPRVSHLLFHPSNADSFKLILSEAIKAFGRTPIRRDRFGTSNEWVWKNIGGLELTIDEGGAVHIANRKPFLLINPPFWSYGTDRQQPQTTWNMPIEQRPQRLDSKRSAASASCAGPVFATSGTQRFDCLNSCHREVFNRLWQQ